ncbi:hypothetical protein TWF481_002746 [Arthrobotrys musiformis]|uniref:Ferric reductase NAD binding domain-containing protein n=1 Tax=Arthrobotrys musiformis TaxID=47236 RepID=A0AAV9VRA7_9PEZI
MAMMNLFILAFGKKLGRLGRVLGVQYNFHASVNNWAGYLATLEASLHAYLAASETTPISKVWPGPGFRAAVYLGTILLAGLLQDKFDMGAHVSEASNKSHYMDLLKCVTDKWYTVIIDGLYGGNFSIDAYGTVFVLATGIGIAGVLPYIKSTIARYNFSEVKTQEIVLMWLLEREGDWEWVEDWMNEMLKADEKYIFKIELYIPISKFGGARRGIMKRFGEHGRLRKIYKEPQWPAIFDQCMSKRRGKTVFLTCVERDVEACLRSLIVECKDSDVYLHAHEFRPPKIKIDAGHMLSESDLEM